jgi:hypothetical protein
MILDDAQYSERNTLNERRQIRGIVGNRTTGSPVSFQGAGSFAVLGRDYIHFKGR